jgi:hypothetical protein
MPIMTRTETLEIQASYLITEDGNPINSVSETRNRIEKTARDLINSHLKTPEEIEADFILEMSGAHSFDTLNKREVLFKNRNHNTENSDTLSSGFMEENY